MPPFDHFSSVWSLFHQSIQFFNHFQSSWLFRLCILRMACYYNLTSHILAASKHHWRLFLGKKSLKIIVRDFKKQNFHLTLISLSIHWFWAAIGHFLFHHGPSDFRLCRPTSQLFIKPGMVTYNFFLNFLLWYEITLQTAILQRHNVLILVNRNE